MLVAAAFSSEKNGESKESGSSYKFRITNSRLCRYMPQSNQENTVMTLRRHTAALPNTPHRFSAESMWFCALPFFTNDGNSWIKF